MYLSFPSYREKHGFRVNCLDNNYNELIIEKLNVKPNLVFCVSFLCKGYSYCANGEKYLIKENWKNFEIYDGEDVDVVCVDDNDYSNGKIIKRLYNKFCTDFDYGYSFKNFLWLKRDWLLKVRNTFQNGSGENTNAWYRFLRTSPNPNLKKSDKTRKICL